MSAAQVEEARERERERERRPTPRQFLKGWVKWLIKRRQSVRLFKRGAMTATYLQRAGGTRPDRGRRTIVVKRPGRARGERGVHVRAFVLSLFNGILSSIGIGYGLFFEGIFFLPFFFLATFLFFSFFFSFFPLSRREEHTRPVPGITLAVRRHLPATFHHRHKVPLTGSKQDRFDPCFWLNAPSAAV